MFDNKLKVAVSIVVAILLLAGLALPVSQPQQQVVSVGSQSVLSNYFRQVQVKAGEDSVPLSVTGYTTQTSALFSLANVSGTSVFSVSNAGAVSVPAGSVPWASMSKSGSALSDLANASAASLTGTLADARLSSNVPLLNAHNTFTAMMTNTAGYVGNLTGNVTAPTATLTNIVGPFTTTQNVVLGTVYIEGYLRSSNGPVTAFDPFTALKEFTATRGIIINGRTYTETDPLTITGVLTNVRFLYYQVP